MEQSHYRNSDPKHCYDVTIEDERPGVKTTVIAVHEKDIKIEDGDEMRMEAWEKELGLATDDTMSTQYRQRRILDRLRNRPTNPDDGLKPT